MKEHLKTKHGNRCHEVKDLFTIRLKLVRQMNAYDCIIHATGEIFYIVTETDHDEVYGCVQYVGQRKTASKYKYEFSIQKIDKTDQISVCHTTRSYMAKRQDIYKKGRCLRVNYNECKHLMDKDRKVRIVVKISEAVRSK
jgi:hypothetical protein